MSCGCKKKNPPVVNQPTTQTNNTQTTSDSTTTQVDQVIKITTVLQEMVSDKKDGQ